MRAATAAPGGGGFLRRLRDSYRYATFRDRYSDSRGIFRTFEEAVESAPRDKPIGYDHAALARRYGEEVDLVSREYDYPILFHLSRILGRSARPLTIFDFGGNVGVHYLNFRKYLPLDDVSWIVCDVPAITEVGRQICAAHRNVHFINDLREVDNPAVDVVVAVGSIQFCCADFAEHFFVRGGLTARHVVISQIILQDGPPFVTLQNGGLSYYPQHVYNRGSFISSVERHGFALIDEWVDHSSGLSLPFHPDRSVPTSSGLCFEAVSSLCAGQSTGSQTEHGRGSVQEATVQPLFSVLIAAYNRSALLPRAIRSVLNQTYRDFELIVIDDASTDDTEETVKRIDDDRVRYVQLAANSGQSEALNAGIELARGEFISFLDSDDEWLPTYLEEVSKAFASSPDAALVYTRFLNGPEWSISGADVYPEVLRQGQLSATSTLSIKAAALRKVGGFRASHSVCNDDDLCFRIAKHFEIRHVPRELTVIHATPGAVTGDPVRDAFGWAKLIDEYRTEIVGYCGRHTLAYHYLRVAELMFGCFQLKQGFKYLSEATALLPGRSGSIERFGPWAITRSYARIVRAGLRGLRWQMSAAHR